MQIVQTDNGRRLGELSGQKGKELQFQQSLLLISHEESPVVKKVITGCKVSEISVPCVSTTAKTCYLSL